MTDGALQPSIVSAILDTVTSVWSGNVSGHWRGWAVLERLLVAYFAVAPSSRLSSAVEVLSAPLERLFEIASAIPSSRREVITLAKLAVLFARYPAFDATTSKLLVRLSGAEEYLFCAEDGAATMDPLAPRILERLLTVAARGQSPHSTGLFRLVHLSGILTDPSGARPVRVLRLPKSLDNVDQLTGRIPEFGPTAQSGLIKLIAATKEPISRRTVARIFESASLENGALTGALVTLLRRIMSGSNAEESIDIMEWCLSLRTHLAQNLVYALVEIYLSIVGTAELDMSELETDLELPLTLPIFSPLGRSESLP